MTGRADAIETAADRGVARLCVERVGIRRVTGQPRLEIILFLDDYGTTHRVVRDTAKLLAQHLETTGFRGSQPQIGLHARHQVHLYAKLCDSEVVQNILGSQQELDRTIDRDMHLRIVDKHVVPAVRVFRHHPERIIHGNELRPDLAELAVLTREPVGPVPLLAHRFHFVRLLRHLDEFPPHDQTRSEHRGNTDRGKYRQPGLEFLVFRFVIGPRVFLVPILDHAYGHENIYRNEYGTGNP